MRPSLQAFMKAIKGKTVFIIGGGPSASAVDFSLLQDEVVVCINDSIHDFPNATGLYWVDETWASENHNTLSNHNCKHRFTSKPSQHISYIRTPDPKTVNNTHILRRTGDHGYDSKYDSVMGNNSGVQVLNLVVNMHPAKVILIGYDMKRDNQTRQTHYHNKPRLPISDYIYNDLFVPSMNALAKGIKDVPVEIINSNKNSAIRCFKFDDYTNHLKG